MGRSLRHSHEVSGREKSSSTSWPAARSLSCSRNTSTMSTALTQATSQPMRRWRDSELTKPTADGRFRRMVIQEERLRSGTLSFAPDELVPEHTHTESDEIYYVI